MNGALFHPFPLHQPAVGQRGQLHLPPSKDGHSKAYHKDTSIFG